jgi:hypothetical protein
MQRNLSKYNKGMKIFTFKQKGAPLKRYRVFLKLLYYLNLDSASSSRRKKFKINAVAII